MTHRAEPQSHGFPFGGDTAPSIPPTMVEVAPQHTRGSSGRVWSMPYSIKRCASMDPSSPLLQIFPEPSITVESTLKFLATYARDDLRDWSDAVGEKIQRAYREMIDAAIEYSSSRKPCEPLATPATTNAPTLVEVPQIDEHHWAYRNHYELGHFKHVSDNVERDCAHEATSDVGSILSYLRRYDDLAHDYTGTKLAHATDTPLYTQPYQTCMALCVFTARLPSHFLALIHYGIGVQFIDMRRTDRVAFVPPSQRPSDPSSRLFERLTQLYVEDFSAPIS